jgi:conjugal transfer pilus assembly protein TraL
MSAPLKVPKHVDEPPIILIWTADEVMTFFAFFIVGFLANVVIPGVVAGYLVTRVIRRAKNTRPRGFMLHTGYWYGFPLQETRTIPNRFDQHFTK